MHNQIASFRAALDARPVSRYQWLILLLLALLLVTDGYDAQVLGYVVPALAQDWGLEKAAFGPVFSANLLGLTLGSLLVTPLADRFGVRRILLACVLIYASLTVLMVFANSLTTLMAARFICGIGMGGAMPSAMALMSEYSPPRMRTLMVTLAACGFSFGGAAGGFVAAGFIDGFGWQAVFLAGGVTPLLLFPFLVWLLPESLPRLLRDAPPYLRLRKVTARMLPDWQPPPATEAENLQEQGSKLTVVELFRNGYARPTLLIWATFFVSLILLYFMISWLPSLLLESGLALNEANLVTSMFLFAGTLGAILMAWFADRLKSKVRLLSGVLAAAALCTILLGLNHDNPCDDEEDNMAMLCCHTDSGEMFLMTRYPDEDELEITLEDEPSTLDGVKVTLSPTRLLIEIGAGDADVLKGDDYLEILHNTPAADLGEVEETLQNILKGTGTYISELN